MAPPSTEEEKQDEKDQDSNGANSKKKKGKKDSKKGWLGGAAEAVPILILAYGAVVAKSYYSMVYPTFPEFDANHQYIEKFTNRIPVGDPMSVHVYIKESKSQPTIPRDAPPVWKIDFKYDEDDFQPSVYTTYANVSQKLLENVKNVWLTARLFTKTGQRVGEAHGKMIKYKKQKDIPTKYWLLSGDVCDEGLEQTYGKPAQTARGLPQMQIRLVYDRTAYPRPWMRDHYYPIIYVDEFWLTEDQLITFNKTGPNQFKVDMHFNLMSAGRWRFQTHMERSLEQNAKMFGEDSEEMMSMRELFANTHPYLLIATMVVSLLHCVFEYLALKSDVAFWNKTDAETLKRYISLRAVVLEIVCNIVLLIYLWDQESNMLILILSLGQVLVDCWKLTRVIKVSFERRFGIIPWLCMESKVPHTGAEEYDRLALKYLSFILVPIIIGYAGYSSMYECHKGWFSYSLHVSASMVYALGFALMTPQLFINYRMKSVAYLPWRRFVYRAINTFIDDLFSFIIRMPTMHRMSCFRDDIVFLIYLYQRHIYPTDTKRAFDEDVADEGGAEGEDKKSK